MNELLNFAMTVDSGHTGRIPSAYNFEYVIISGTTSYLKFKI
jgi:hypothetical protein